MDEDEEAKKKVEQEYLDGVKWLREHVAPDDVYDFAHQSLLAAEYFIYKMYVEMDFHEELKKDRLFANWIHNVTAIQKLKDDGFHGILDVNYRLEKK